MKNSSSYDLIVIGSGMGGMSAASMFAKDGYRVLILEAAHAPGGCSSSYYRKGYTFESGATTLIGFDEHQPLRILEDHLGISLPKTAIEPSMTVHLDGGEIVRWQDQDRWLKEAITHFGEPSAQREFWSLAHRVSKVVWKVSGKNPLFPPQQISDWFHLLKNDPRDVWVLPYALSSVKEIARRAGITNAKFYRFLDEQLMISAQAPADDTPFLFGAPAITYTNSTNYTVQGGLIEMVKHLQRYVEERGGELHTKEKVTSLDQKEEGYIVATSKNRRYRAPLVVSNIPVWNMGDITTGKVNEYFKNESAKYDRAGEPLPWEWLPLIHTQKTCRCIIKFTLAKKIKLNIYRVIRFLYLYHIPMITFVAQRVIAYSISPHMLSRNSGLISMENTIE